MTARPNKQSTPKQYKTKPKLCKSSAITNQSQTNPKQKSVQVKVEGQMKIWKVFFKFDDWMIGVWYICFRWICFRYVLVWSVLGGWSHKLLFLFLHDDGANPLTSDRTKVTIVTKYTLPLLFFGLAGVCLDFDLWLQLLTLTLTLT